MAQYNVTRDIRKLAEEAEKDKNLNSTVATAGVGLSGFVASQTGGSANNPTKPTNLTIQANEAQARANQVNLDKATNQYRSNVNLNQLDPAKNLNINDPSDFKKSVTQNVVKSTMTPPKFEGGPRPDYRPGASEARPTPTRKIPNPGDMPQMFDSKGNRISKTPPKQFKIDNLASLMKPSIS